MVDRGTTALLSVLEALPVTAVITDLATAKILWVNARDVRLSGALSPEDVVGMNILDFLDPTQQGEALRGVEAIGSGVSTPPTFYRLKRLDGTRAHVVIASAPIEYLGARAMLSLVTDVNEHGLQVDALRESEEHYRTLVDGAPFGVLVTVGDEIRYANPSALAALHAPTPQHVVGKLLFRFISPDYHSSLRDARRQVLAKGARWATIPVTLTCCNGEAVDASAEMAATRWEGEVATKILLHSSE